MLKRAALPLLCFALASCDVFYGVCRRADAPSSFDPRAAQEILRKQPGFDAVDALAWDGTNLWCPFRLDGAIAGFSYSPLEEYGESGLVMESLWVGHPPDADLLRKSLLLQDTLLRLLSEQLPDFPPPSTFSTEWVNMEAQDGAAADERPQAGARG
jgi:hypothetical protein